MRKQASTPAGHRLYAIGDIHGSLGLLTRLLGMIEQDALKHPNKEKKLIFLGDYVDRGLDPKGTLERLTQSFAAGLQPVFLRGNHDEMLLEFIKGEIAIAPVWLKTGGVSTLASYGLPSFVEQSPEKLRKLSKNLDEKIPPHHKAFLEKTVNYASFGDYYFVHAGIRPDVPLGKQRPEDQLWIRDGFVNSRKRFSKMIIHGHTIALKVENKPNRIGIDTGAYATGQLTCLVLEGVRRKLIHT